MLALLASAARATDPAALEAILLDALAPDEAGCSAAVAEGGEVTWTGAVGLADARARLPLTPETPVDLGSVAKMFTAAVIGHLADAGKVDLDAPIGLSMPELARLDPQPTLRQVLQHSAGLRDPYVLPWPWPDGAPRDNAEVVAWIASHPDTAFAPGSQYEYSNAGYVVAAELASRVDGAPFPEVARARLFEPLALPATFGLAPDRAAVDHDWGGKPYRDARRQPVGDGGIWTTPAAVLAFVAGVPDLPATTRDLLTTPATLGDGRTSAYGAGVELEPRYGHRAWGHTGDDRGYHAAVVYLPDARVGAAVACNFVSARPSRLVDALMGALGYPPEPPPPPVEPTEADIAAVVGLWRTAWGAGVLTLVRGTDTAVRLEGGGPVLYVGDGTWRDERGQLQLRHRDGVLTAKIAGAPEQPFVRTDPWTSDAAEMARYAGTFRCEMLDEELVVSVRKDRWRVIGRRLGRGWMDPLFPGTMVGGPLALTGPTAGPVDTLLLGISRARNVPCVRTSP